MNKNNNSILENDSLKATAEKVIEQLSAVKEEFIKNKEELELSIRRDVVKVELKSIIAENKDYDSLKKALEKYVDNIIILEKR